MRFHPDRYAAWSIVIPLTNRDANTPVANRVDGIHDDAQALVERCCALDVDQRRVQREIVISVTQQPSNPDSQRGRQCFEQRELFCRPPFFSGSRCGVDGHVTYCPLLALIAPTILRLTSRAERARAPPKALLPRRSASFPRDLHRPAPVLADPSRFGDAGRLCRACRDRCGNPCVTTARSLE